jgi:phage tail sheath protein FI
MERILPGVTVTTKEEGLTVPQPGAANVIGMIGTASWGPIGEAVILGSYSDTVDNFKIDASNTTLFKGLSMAYLAGASSIVAIRIASSSARYASTNLGTEISIKAKYKGTYGNRISVLVTTNSSNPSNVDVRISDGLITENYINKPSNQSIVDEINTKSSLVTATKLNDTLISPQSETFLVGGDDGASVTNADYINGLTLLEKEDVNFVVCAGQTDAGLHSAMEAHCQNMANAGKERIAIGGTALGETVSQILSRTASLSSDRFILVAPGVKIIDNTTGDEILRSGGYTACMIAGKLSSLPINYSLTNKAVSGVSGLEYEYSDAELKQLINGRVCALRKLSGFRVAKGITTSTTSAWSQITTRRIVDYVKQGIRSIGNDYIGRLNNEIVRSSLKGVIDSFLQTLKQDEVLVDAKSDVYATRQDEIAGVCKVNLQIMPVFSIDYIECTIYLQ